MNEAPRDPAEQYAERMRARGAEAAELQRRHVLLGYVRLALVVGGLVLVWLGFYQRTIPRWWVLLPCAAFVVAARIHSAVLRRRETARRSIAYFEQGVARVEDRWDGLAHREVRADTSTSLYAEDLDLFCRGGLFDLLCTARTSIAEDMLAGWLLQPVDVQEIVARQEAIAELRTMLELREELASREGPDVARLDAEALARWATWEPLIPAWMRWMGALLAALTVAAFGLFLAGGPGWPLALAVVIDASVTYGVQSRTRRALGEAEEASRSLRLAAALMESLEQREFESELLKELRGRLVANNARASHALKRLAGLAQAIEYRLNYIVRILDAPLMYSVQLAGAVQAWQREHGGALREWLRALAQMEALVSLATYSFEHPADPFPEMVEGAPRFEAEQLGHPLLAASTCVRNDVSLGGAERLLLVSGSNMSGKSTLLRAVGTNAVLAMAGAPARAGRLRMTPLRVGASIQVHDSLQQGRSRFYAEVLRLRDVIALSEGGAPLLFLLDELFGGTNSSDRLAGAEGIARALMANGAIGLISTHDLALTAMGGDDHLALRNVHFEDRIEDGKMMFDFKLRDGVVHRRNGLELMRMAGLKV